MTQDEIDAAILANLLGPKRVSVGDQEVEQHSISDQLKAAEYTGGQGAAALPQRGLRFTQLIPPAGGGTP